MHPVQNEYTAAKAELETYEQWLTDNGEWENEYHLLKWYEFLDTEDSAYCALVDWAFTTCEAQTGALWRKAQGQLETLYAAKDRPDVRKALAALCLRLKG